VKVSGFTFIRNGSLLGYPFVESIRSVLPLCDEFVVAVGEGDDDTLAAIHGIGSDKLIVMPTRWNEKMADRGFVYAQQKMIAQYNCTGDWAFYLEGDEVVHQDDLPVIRAALERHVDDARVEALVFDYHHFFGSPQWRAISPGWYRRAPRILRNTIRSWAPDGLFWVVMDRNKRGRYPNAALAGAPIYHYGHVRRVAAMREKNQRVGKYWGHDHPLFNGYQIDPMAIEAFAGSHPAIVADWLATEAESEFRPDAGYRPNARELKHRRLMVLERWFGLDLGHKHYRLVR
jgi:hypothetical protein